MINYKVQTFLALYEKMNYRAAAEVLNLTQPAVTQHIHALEHEYGCKLFYYDGKHLHRTEAAEKLAVFARAMLYSEAEMRQELRNQPREVLRIGATKTIGEFVVGDLLLRYLEKTDAPLSLTVDNTQTLLSQLEHGILDFALIEGTFDKQKYGFHLFREEPFVGICAAGSLLDGKTVALESLFPENLILREVGSGTRAIFEQLLSDSGYSISAFRQMVCISDFHVICHLVQAGYGISFVYQAVADSSPGLGTFSLKNRTIQHEFHYVYLKGTKGAERAAAFGSTA